MAPIALAGLISASLLAAPVAPASRPAPPEAAAAARTIDFEFTDLDGRTSWLSDLKGHRAIVVVMRDTGCPISRSYAPHVARMEESYGARGVAFLYLNVNRADSPETIRAEIERFGFEGRYVHDPEARIGRILGVRSTGEVFVLDGGRRLLYRGALDDQYGIGYTRPSPRHEYLRDALDRVLAGKPVDVSESDAPGCLLGLEKERIGYAGPVTYHNRVSRIVQENCQACHRAEGMAPFALESYDQVSSKRTMIAFMIRNRRMPPWFAHRDVGEFANDRSLPDADMTDLLRWVDEGAAEGDPRDAPAPRTWAAGWQIGEPDAVIPMPDPFRVPAEGVVDYQYFYVKTDFPEDRWIERMELRPGAKQQVHHALVFIEEPGRKQGAERRPGDPPFQGGASGFFAGYAPGTPGNTYPAGTAKLLPKGAWLKFQMHYTTTGVAADDVTELGIVFAKAPPRAKVETRAAINTEFVIPPEAPDHEVVAERTFTTAGTILALFPHMHVRGKAFEVDLVYPDGTERPLLRVPRYDFNWQLSYELREPLAVPAGAKLRATGWFDNSPENPGNPDPTKEVRHGEQSWDEMMIGYFDWIPAAEASGGRQ
jgi:thiol-disulfide isomerase/thioredoxin/mono/diheme cytochrome c family protein